MLIIIALCGNKDLLCSIEGGADPLKLPCVIDSLADLTGTGTSKKITFGAKNKAKLSVVQLAQITDKGWVLG